MTKKDEKKLFEFLTEDPRGDSNDFMDMPKFFRVWEKFQDKFWWIPWALSFAALIVSILKKQSVL